MSKWTVIGKTKGMERTKGIMQVLKAGSADDRRGDALFLQYPCDGDLGHAHSLLLRDLLNAVFNTNQYLVNCAQIKYGGLKRTG